MFPCARFDDLTPGAERAFTLRGLRDTVIARRVDEVVDALQTVESAVAEGAWAGGYVAYEAAPAFDRAFRVRGRDDGDPFEHLPLVWFGLFDDREIIEPVEPRSGGLAPYSVSNWTPSVSREEYVDAIHRIQEHIGNGDTYQVNHTFRLRAAFAGEAPELYRDLALAQRGSFSVVLDTGRYRVISASPELFFRLDDDRLTTRPMKGTARRGRWLDEDIRMAERLVGSDKDRAENLMIVDLLRNDLGRVARFGSVRVSHMLELERYETLWQLTTTIEADLEPEVTVTEIMRALFPSGSVTGAPKARTMELIAELEQYPRGVYCGAIGYLAPPGADGADACFNVAIRTVVVDQEEGLAEYGTGGGITWDSASVSEYEEAKLKAEVLTQRRPEFRLLETLRYEPADGFFWLQHHLDRLAASAEYFGFSVEIDELAATLAAAVADTDAALKVRLLVDRNGRAEVERLPIVARFQFEAPSVGELPLRVTLDETVVQSDDVFLFHKTTKRDVYDRRRRNHPELDDVLLMNERSEVTEATVANLVVKFGGRWWTPKLDAGVLQGVFRRVLLDEGVIRERVIFASELDSAEDLGLINSVRGWQRAVMVDAVEGSIPGLASLG